MRHWITSFRLLTIERGYPHLTDSESKKVHRSGDNKRHPLQQLSAAGDTENLQFVSKRSRSAR